MIDLLLIVLYYVVYPVFLGLLGCWVLNFAIRMCGPLIVELFTQIGIEKQCSEIKEDNEQNKQH